MRDLCNRKFLVMRCSRSMLPIHFRALRKRTLVSRPIDGLLVEFR